MGLKTNFVADVIGVSGFQLGSPAIVKYIKTLKATGGINRQTAIELLRLAKSGGNASDAIEVLNENFRETMVDAKEAARSAEGLESTLGGVFYRTMSELGTEGLVEYKEILSELIGMLREIRDEDAFKELGSSLARFLSVLSDSLDSGVLAKLLRLLTIVVDTISVLTSVTSKLPKVTDMIPGSPFGTAAAASAAVSGDSIFSDSIDSVKEISQGLYLIATETSKVAENTETLK